MLYAGAFVTLVVYRSARFGIFSDSTCVSQAKELRNRFAEYALEDEPLTRLDEIAPLFDLPQLHLSSEQLRELALGYRAIRRDYRIDEAPEVARCRFDWGDVRWYGELRYRAVRRGDSPEEATRSRATEVVLTTDRTISGWSMQISRP